MTGNAVVKEHYEANKEQLNYKSQFLNYTPLFLPFYDDFSEMTIYPDTSRWLDNEAYINDHFPYFPVNYGVATLDAIDATGDLYPEASPFTFIADRLTSKPIRLDSLFDENGVAIKKFTAEDSIYLSFYYQPHGRGDVPLGHDSLILEFGYYTMDTVFSHFDSVYVYGWEYMIGGEEYLLPNDFISPPAGGCDTNIFFTLKDTLFPEDMVRIPCDSVFVLETEWENVWSAAGDTLANFIVDNDAFFNYVVVPIVDTIWLRKDFQFRFKNYASISEINSWQSNTDQWHIDMVYLDYSRTLDDHYTHEIRFSERPGSFIEDYSTMPYEHYAGDVTAYKKDNFPVYINNTDSIDHDITYNYFVLNSNGDTLEPFLMDNIAGTMVPITQQNVNNYQPFAEPPITYFYTSQSEDTADFYISHVVYDNEMPEIGDTLVYHQKFRNYFSYDDGSAEAGYGLSPAGAQLAIRYRSEEPDTIRGLQMFFNRTFNDNNDRLFSLVVWNDNNGIPGNVLYVEENVRPEFTWGLNHFYNHEFRYPDSVKLGVQEFYVGWIQQSNHNLNVGFDRNVNSRSKNFYNVNGAWTNSSFEGSIMIRPIVGKPLSEPESKYKAVPEKLSIYPNPPGSVQEVHIQLPASCAESSDLKYLTLRIFDVFGKMIYEGPYVEKFPVYDLGQGFYIVSLHNSAQSSNHTAKLLIVK